MGCDHLSLHLNQKSTPLVIICCMTQPPACHAYWRAFVSWLFCIKGASISRYFGLFSSSRNSQLRKQTEQQNYGRSTEPRRHHRSPRGCRRSPRRDECAGWPSQPGGANGTEYRHLRATAPDVRDLLGAPQHDL